MRINQLVDLDDDIQFDPEDEDLILEALDMEEDDEFWLLDQEYEDRFDSLLS